MPFIVVPQSQYKTYCAFRANVCLLLRTMRLYNGYKLTRKANIMENNVPREKWLYPDRCMKKWLGWILSDHSAYMEKASISERPVEPKPEQSQETISDILEDAWQNAKL